MIPFSDMAVFRVQPEATLGEVAQLLSQANKACDLDRQGQAGGPIANWGHNISCMIVTEGDRPVSIATDRDVVRWMDKG